ncbi:leukocyte elastase inhibitor-like isoform X1 [Scyliorhinus torazame]|uniref:leukocyte elastase inhibitor-like isoform X1 n=1 Tax=Scyliorhinus torazame TaxID=75743 RepID=UPI003B5AE491
MPAVRMYLRCWCALLGVSAATCSEQGRCPERSHTQGGEVSHCKGGSNHYLSSSPRRLGMDLLSASNGKFAVDLFKQLNKDDTNGNIFVSPFSISAALAMVYLGAKGNTAAQMAEVLAFDKVQDLHSEFQKLQATINQPSANYLLKLANRLYGAKTYTFLEDFIVSTLKYYQAELAAVDFVSASEEARQQINSWTEAQTEGKIKNLLAEGTVDGLTKLVLVNAIYFKGNWERKFQEQNTYEGEFRINQNETKPVQMMRQKAKFNMAYISEIKAKVLELPYVQSELSMIVLLPDRDDNSDGLQNLQNRLTFDKLMDWTNPEKMDNMEVKVVLPKFRLEEKYDLKSTLTLMGMADAFSQSQANFSGMAEKNDLVLSKVVHKAFVEVNEEGTEAAAATAAIVMLRCAMVTPEFVADHPFLFFIRHNKTRSILFFGKLASP